MMGGDGTNINGEIGELHLSAISEAMNQMMGSSATSLSSMLNRTIDISPPIAEVVDLKNTLNEGEIDSFLSEEFVKISFHMEIGDLVDSEIMQLYPPAFVKEMCKGVSQNMELDTQSVTEDVPQSSNTATQAAPIQQPQDSGSMNNASANSQGMINENMMNSNMNSQNMMNQGMMNQNMGAQNMIGNQVNVQNAQFTPFGAMPNQVYQPENIDLIMDVPLEVTVELGRTKKSISEILDFGPGKIIELNKLAGEPIDMAQFSLALEECTQQFNIVCKVINCTQSLDYADRYFARSKFIFDRMTEREKIVRFVFEEERRIRRREME